MEYNHLTPEEQRQVIAEIRATRPTPEQLVATAELEHWRACVHAAIGMNDLPGFLPPDTTQAAAEHAALDELEATLWQ